MLIQNRTQALRHYMGNVLPLRTLSINYTSLINMLIQNKTQALSHYMANVLPLKTLSINYASHMCVCVCVCVCMKECFYFFQPPCTTHEKEKKKTE